MNKYMLRDHINGPEEKRVYLAGWKNGNAKKNPYIDYTSKIHHIWSLGCRDRLKGICYYE